MSELNGDTLNQNEKNQVPKREVGLGLGIGIFFMPYLFSWLTLRKGHSSKSKFIGFAWMLFVILGAFGKQPSHNARNVSSIEPATSQQNELAFVKESCLKLSNTFGAGSKLSDLQKDELWKDYSGKAFEWNLTVTEVSKAVFGDGYTVQYKCAGSDSFIQDIQINYPESNKSLVLSLQKGEAYKVKGVLSRSSTLLGLTADSI